MALGIHIFMIKDYSRPHEPGQVLGRFRGDHYADPAFGAKMKRLWHMLKIERGMDLSIYWAPAHTRPVKKWSPERKAKNRRTRFINRMKKKYPLFSVEYIRRRYPDHLVCPACASDLDEEIAFCCECGDVISDSWKRYGDLEYWVQLI